MAKITNKKLQKIVNHINDITGSPLYSYTIGNEFHNAGKTISCVGNYHLSYQNGGVALLRMESEGGTSDVLQCGYTSNRLLYELMHAFIRGYNAAIAV